MPPSALPKTMKAVQILGPKSSPNLILNPSQPLPTPPPSTSNNQPILVRVHAAALTADELTWPELYTTTTRIPGLDISGTVVSVPDSVVSSAWKAGDAIYALLHPDRSAGGQAEYVYSLADELVRKPSSLTHAQAAALPIPAVTAWEMVVEHVGLEWLRERGGGPGARVLVTGAAGAVGSMLVQLVRVLVPGTKVIALARREREGYLRELGVDEVVVPGDDGGWVDEVGRRSVDAVLDTVGGEAFSRTWDTVKDDGVLVTVADPAPAWAHDKSMVPAEAEGRPGVRYVYFIVSPDSTALGQVADMIDKGQVKPLPVVEFPTDKAVEAWKHAGQRGRKGKVVINLVADA